MVNDTKLTKSDKKTYKTILSSGLAKPVDKDLYLRIKAELNELSDTINYLKVNDNLSDQPLIEKLLKERRQHGVTSDLVYKALEVMSDLDKNNNHRLFYYFRASKKKLDKFHYKVTRFEDIDDIDLLREFSILNTEAFYKFGSFGSINNLFVITIDNIDNLPSSYNTVPYELVISSNKKEFIVIDMACLSANRATVDSDTVIKQIYQSAKDKFKKMSSSEKLRLENSNIEDIRGNSNSKMENIIAMTKLSSNDL